MALTITTQHEGVIGDHRYWYGLVQFDSSYPTGGEVVTAADFGLTELWTLSCDTGITATKRVAPSWLDLKLKILIEDGTSGIEAEAANTSNQAGVVVNVKAYGR